MLSLSQRDLSPQRAMFHVAVASAQAQWHLYAAQRDL
jgi:hypothetical protein